MNRLTFTDLSFMQVSYYSPDIPYIARSISIIEPAPLIPLSDFSSLPPQTLTFRILYSSTL